MKVTEKQSKARCTELNLGPLKDASFGVKGELEQWHNYSRCETAWYGTCKLTGYQLSGKPE